MINKRFITIWATVSVAGAFTSQSTNKPLAASVGWAILGFVAACMDYKASKKEEN